MEIVYISIFLILLLVIINYIFPFLYLRKQEGVITNEKNKKREFIKKIALQREIEEEIEKEINGILKN